MPVIDRLADVPALVGKELGVSDWMTIDQARIDAFADAQREAVATAAADY